MPYAQGTRIGIGLVAATTRVNACAAVGAALRQCDASRSPNRGWLSARCRGSHVAIARMMARSEGEFESMLSAMDITVSENSVKAVRSD